MKVVVTGSREGYKKSGILRAFIPLCDEENLIVIHGGARGADTDVANLAEIAGHIVHEVPALWDDYGKGAGYRRNIEMLDHEPDMVFAFWNGTSNGTRHTFQEALKRLASPNHAIKRVDIYL